MEALVGIKQRSIKNRRTEGNRSDRWNSRCGSLYMVILEDDSNNEEGGI